MKVTDVWMIHSVKAVFKVSCIAVEIEIRYLQIQLTDCGTSRYKTASKIQN